MVLGCALACTAAKSTGEITLFAAASLRDACGELAAAFEAQTGARVVCHFASSNLLARQILDGAPCDLFLSAGAPQVDELERAGLLQPGTRIDFAANTLVVVQPDPLPADLPAVRVPRDLLDPRIGRLALADPQGVPAGRYAREWLESLGLWEPLAARSVPALDVRAALALVEAGAAGAAVVYATDARAAARARVALEIAAADGPPIVYPAAVLSGAREPDLARRFLAFLEGEGGRAILVRHGFRDPTDG